MGYVGKLAKMLCWPLGYNIEVCGKACCNEDPSLSFIYMYKADLVTGFIQASLSKIQGLLKTILQFSRTKSLGKILI